MKSQERLKNTNVYFSTSLDTFFSRLWNHWLHIFCFETGLAKRDSHAWDLWSIMLPGVGDQQLAMYLMTHEFWCKENPGCKPKTSKSQVFVQLTNPYVLSEKMASSLIFFSVKAYLKLLGGYSSLKFYILNQCNQQMVTITCVNHTWQGGPLYHCIKVWLTCSRICYILFLRVDVIALGSTVRWARMQFDSTIWPDALLTL